MKRIILILISAGFILGSISCETERMDSLDINDIPIVEAYLIPGEEVTISVSQPLPFSDDTNVYQEAISGLQIIISEDSEAYLLSDSLEPGIYTHNNEKFLPEEGSSYSMYFVYRNDTIKASTIIPSKPNDFSISDNNIQMDKIEEGDFGFGFTDPIELTWSNPDGSNHFVFIEYLDSVKNLINLNFDTADVPRISNSPILTEAGYSLRPMEIYFFGIYRIVLFKVNQEYADLFEGNDQSSIELTNPNTNIEGGYGIFTGLNSDTVFLTVSESSSDQ
jgi:hypothetical protein